jgi:transcriptional regulator with XRE-family HTH domain
MAIGERIRFFRNKKGVTQRYLGQVVGFPERSADVRMAQYETGSRTPKADLTKTLAGFFEVSTDALTVPDIDSDIGLMHTLFALEDIRGLTIGEINGEICLRLDKSRGRTYLSMLEMLSRWANEAKKLESGKITREEYDHWRYTYPAVEAQRTRDRLDALRAKQKAAETDE